MECEPTFICYKNIVDIRILQDYYYFNRTELEVVKMGKRGDWRIIEKIIGQELTSHGYHVTIYVLDENDIPKEGRF